MIEQQVVKYPEPTTAKGIIMKGLLYLGAAAVACLATQTNAADLVSAEVSGPSGTIWNTAADSFYTLFLVRPFGNIINPEDNFTSAPTNFGSNDYALAGDGFPVGTSANSDLIYTLTLIFADGATITGQYFDSTFSAGTSATVGNITYTMTGFGWDRSPANNVSAFRAVSGGDPADYTGQFAFSQVAAAVPEPATWGMMLLGFGMIGAASRQRRRAVRVSYG